MTGFVYIKLVILHQKRNLRKSLVLFQHRLKYFSMMYALNYLWSKLLAFLKKNEHSPYFYDHLDIN